MDPGSTLADSSTTPVSARPSRTACPAPTASDSNEPIPESTASPEAAPQIGSTIDSAHTLGVVPNNSFVATVGGESNDDQGRSQVGTNGTMAGASGMAQSGSQAGVGETAPSESVASSTSWQVAMKTAIRSGVELCRRLQLPSSWEELAARAERQFPVFAPLSYIERMRPGDPHDPLLLQVLPLAEEMHDVAGYTPDPVGDHTAAIAPRLLQKYSGRVLLLTTGTCAVHCRYCFRREYPYASPVHPSPEWDSALAAIEADASIHEVLLSGGDPLTLTDPGLTRLVNQLAAIPHLQRIRVHTRLPIVIPQRVTDELLDWLLGTRLAPVMVVHTNHVQELDTVVGESLRKLVRAGVPVLNQAVLLRRINDTLAAQIALSERLVNLGVFPYYLHQLDRVRGAAHFEVPLEQGRQLIAALRAALPGYAVPRYVQELAGEAHKRPLA